MRVRLLQQEFGNRLTLEWRSFLLRPEPEAGRSLEKFRQYTQSWLRVSADEPSGEFRPWATDEGPPSHSIPPHLIAKGAARIGDDAFTAVHDALLKAYFQDNRDITSEATLRSIWKDCGLADDAFEECRNPELLNRVIEEHNEAITAGATGAPAFRMSHHDIAITGAHPVETLSRWIQRVLDDRV